MNTVRVYIAKFVIFVFALQILNLSVCGGEGNDLQCSANSRTIGELNQIDCLFEFVTEIVFKCEDLIKETGFHNSTGTHSLVVKPHINIKLFTHSYLVKIPEVSMAMSYTVPRKIDCRVLCPKEVIPHPPNAQPFRGA